MKTLTKTAAIALAATALFATPSIAKVDRTGAKFIDQAVDTLPELELRGSDTEIFASEFDKTQPQLVRVAASRTTKRRAKVRVSTRTAKKRRFKKPAYLKASRSGTTNAAAQNSDAKGSPVYNLPEDFAP